MNDLMCKIRNAVLNDTFIQLKENFLEGYKTTDEGIRLTQKKKWLARRIKQG
jgi:queuine/archaeosine tRNA-ribosyltransferase